MNQNVESDVTNLWEERIVIWEPDTLFVVVTRFADEEHRLDVGVDESNTTMTWEPISSVDSKGLSKLLQRVSISVNLQFTAIVRSLQRHDVRETADSTAVVFPIYQMAVRWVNKFEKRGKYHVAAVTRGILFSGAILLSLIAILERWPAFSSHSREWAVTVEMSTSPPK
jgi:hypothetical protein